MSLLPPDRSAERVSGSRTECGGTPFAWYGAHAEGDPMFGLGIVGVIILIIVVLFLLGVIG